MEMTVLVCADCGYQAIPPKYGCPKCASDQLGEKRKQGTGSIYSYTTIRVAGGKFASQLPYTVVLVDLDGGLRVTARLEGDQASIGQRVQLNRVDESTYWFV